MNVKKFEQSLNKIKLLLEEEDKARDSVFQLQRKIIQKSSEAIKSIHRKEYDEADEKINDTKVMFNDMFNKVRGIKSLECWRGLEDAAQEIGEAIILNSVVREDEIPSVEECHISFSGYLLATSDAIGELRRYMLDSLRERDFENAQRAFDYMDYLYSELMTIDYTKMLVGPLRVKLDGARNLVNKSRTDLLTAIQANDLKQSMSELADKLDKFKKSIKEK